MQDEQFERWLRDAAPTYNEPPTADVDDMWANIAPHLPAALPSPFVARSVRTPWWAQQWVRAAAILAIGIGLGRVSRSTNVSTGVASVVSTVGDATPGGTSVGASRDVERDAVRDASTLSALSGPATDEYLGQTVALLASLQNDASTAPRNDRLSERAGALLSTTRFLLDSPSGTDARIRALLEDLELVLVQVVQMPSRRSTTDVEHIHQAMSERDVMPRLRTAVANINSAD